VPAFRPVRFPGPPSEPDVRLSPHPALHQARHRRCSSSRFRSTLHALMLVVVRRCSPSASAIPVRCCCLAVPLRHVTGFPGLGLLRGLRHAMAPSADDEPSHHPQGGGSGNTMTLPTFTTLRSTREVPSSAPAASPHLRRRLSVWPRSRPPKTDVGVAAPDGVACAAKPACICQVEAGGTLTGRKHWFLSYTFWSCLPGPDCLAVPARPVVVRAAPTLACVSTLRLPSASPACCDSPAVGSFHPHPVEIAPRGALGVGSRSKSGPRVRGGRCEPSVRRTRWLEERRVEW